MIHEHYKFDIKRYLEEVYGHLEFKSVDFKNSCFDFIIHNKNINLNIEYKCRYFKTGENDHFLYQDDILIELFQSVFEILKLTELNNKNINKKTSSQRINIAVGWFYKCTADRFLYLRYLDGDIYDIVDIDYKQFKNWFMNNLHSFELQFSGKTTGTINAKIKLSQIPANMVAIKKMKSLNQSTLFSA